MKVKELITKLQEFDPESHVWFKCYDTTGYGNNVFRTEKPTFLNYKSVNEVIIDITDYFTFEEYNSERYKKLDYTWSMINNES